MAEAYAFLDQENDVLNKNQTEKIAEYVIGCKLPELAQCDESSISELLKITEMTLESNFGEESTITVSNLVLREKVHRSLYIIENSSDITSEELAMRLGFKNTEEFVHLFKKELLVEPDRYIFIVKNRHILKCV